MRTLLRWNLNKLTKTIVAILLNKFDCFIVIEGGTGIGKSTLAFEIALGVSREFRRLYHFREDLLEYYYERVGKKIYYNPEDFMKKILDLKEKKAYKFMPSRDLIYSQNEMQEFLASWNRVGIPDEMINVTFNRDFYSETQKNIVKMINMFRDHENLIISCVPYFQNLDNQIKNLCKIKITVKKRGIAIMHTPNKIIYCKDKWDAQTNEKIEREWIMKKIINPNYSKLTTFRGILKFPPLPKKYEVIYQGIKNKKRNMVLKDEMGIELKDSKDVVEILINRLVKGGIKNMQVIEGVAIANDKSLAVLQQDIRKRLMERGVNPMISSYFYDKKAKQEADDGSVSII